MTYQSPSLWHMRSKVLQGFYKSEVLVAATSREDAIMIALQAYDHWLKQQLEDMGFHPLISESFPDDEGFKEESKLKRQEFHAELKESFAQNPHRGLVMVSS
ncbi:MAG: hypothetical protein ABJN42_15030 [Roseibium sp.]|uniref:hypothetical protein n=1 Tax=Roseibium sp. TaxID=1936156 RepID=UPI003297CF2A